MFFIATVELLVFECWVSLQLRCRHRPTLFVKCHETLNGTWCELALYKWNWIVLYNLKNTSADSSNGCVPGLDGRWPAASREHHRRKSPRSLPESPATSDLHQPHNRNRFSAGLQKCVSEISPTRPYLRRSGFCPVKWPCLSSATGSTKRSEKMRFNGNAATYMSFSHSWWLSFTWRYSVKKDPSSVFNRCLWKHKCSLQHLFSQF